MEPRISIVTIGVDDLERSRRFYRDALGWPESSAGNEAIAFFRTRGVVLALFPRAEAAADANLPVGRSGYGGITLAHNVATPEAVDATLDEVVRAGATLLKPATDASWGGRSGYFADPDGYPWEVAWAPGFKLGPDGGIELPE